MPFAARDEVERFFEKVDVADCWVWTGGVNQSGYGRFVTRQRVLKYAHRWCYEHLVGPIPETLDHLCKNRACVNPDHLEPVSQRENSLRVANFRSPTCGVGHDEFSYYTRRDGTEARVCRPCKRAYDKAKRAA